MSKVQVEIACPGCQQKFPMALEDITPGRSRACPSCGTTMKFSGKLPLRSNPPFCPVSADVLFNQFARFATSPFASH